MTDPALARPTEHGRFYHHPRTAAEVPSITNITGMKFKPLFKAGLKKAANYAADNRAMLANLDRDAVYTLVVNPPNAPNEPSEVGTLVHGWIERFIKAKLTGNEADLVTAGEAASAVNTARWMYQSFLAFDKHYKPEYTASEFTVWSNRYGYAGTADFSMRLGGTHVLVDAKTGKQPYPEVAMQLAAIAKADFVLAADGTESRLPAYDGYAVLHVRPRSATLHPVYRIEEAFQSFLGLKAVFDWNVHSAPASIGFAPQIKP
jgi:hypothetical protein